MPQLCLQPWFTFMAWSWLVLLVFSTMKISKFVLLNNPSVASLKNTNSPWTWPWL